MEGGLGKGKKVRSVGGAGKNSCVLFNKGENLMANPDSKEVHAAVRDHYGQIARQTDAGCCATDTRCDCSPARLYSDDQLKDLPQGLADVSLGCGNPVSEIDMRPGDTVVDLGSGGGLDCFLAAKKVGPQGRVIGVDMTPEMIEKACANAVKVGAANVEFRFGRIEKIPLADGEADVVISNCVINLSPDKAAVFREVFRVLRPGGRVSITDIVTNGPMSPLIEKSLESWAGCVAGAIAAEEYRRGLADAGFADAKVIPVGGTPLSGVAQKTEGLPFSALITARKPRPSAVPESSSRR
jgi:arsenite methyltransferase